MVVPQNDWRILVTVNRQAAKWSGYPSEYLLASSGSLSVLHSWGTGVGIVPVGIGEERLRVGNNDLRAKLENLQGESLIGQRRKTIACRKNRMHCLMDEKNIGDCTV